MEKFNRTLRGYDPVEVNNFLDKVIKQVEVMVSEISEKDTQIRTLNQKVKDTESLEVENRRLKEKLEQYRRTEETMNKAIVMAQKTSDQMRIAAHHECEAIIDDAKKNANRIVNEALLRAEKTENEANMLRRNISIFKRRLKNIIEAQMEVIEEIDKVEI